MLFYNMSTLLKFAALVKLRYTQPLADRPFKIPLGNKVRERLTPHSSPETTPNSRLNERLQISSRGPNRA
jgi:hypothetical protein